MVSAALSSTLLFSSYIVGFGFQVNRHRTIFQSAWTRRFDTTTVVENSAEIADTPATISTEKGQGDAKPDFSVFQVGQEYNGTIISSKPFGFFVDINMGHNVLLPRSLLSRGNYEKLKNIFETKSKESIRIALTGVSAENRTLSGKIIANQRGRPDLSSLVGIDKSRIFNATVLSAHDFGVFVNVEGLDVEGLVPTSKLENKVPKELMKKTYP